MAASSVNVAVTRDAAADVSGIDTSGGGLDLDEFDARKFLHYYTGKRVKVQVWQLGLAFRVFQAGLIGWVAYTVFSASQWAASTATTSSVNAWVSNGARTTVPSTAIYCNNNASYDFDYGSGWTYYTPECVEHTANEISQKAVGQIFVTTMYTETIKHGWACDEPEATSKAASCTSTGGTTLTPEGAQCGCVTQRTIFPLGVEKMTISFRHQFKTMDETSAGDSLVAAGATSSSNPTVQPLKTIFEGVFPNASDVQVESGGAITFPLATWLAMVNVSLDEENMAEDPDVRAGINRRPMYRTTGATINVEIEYSNKNRMTDLPDIGITSVTAEAKLERPGGWAGLGALPTVYYVAPSNHTYHTVSRYRQGVVINFRGHGAVYRFDLITVVFALVAGSVLLSMAATLTDIIATNLYRIDRGGKCGWKFKLSAASRVLRAKRSENVSPDAVMAAQGMQAAIAVSSFLMLDTDKDGVVDADDIMTAFARVGGISYESARETAKVIMMKGDQTGKKADGRLSFTEFVSVLQEDMMPFGQMLECMQDRATKGNFLAKTREIKSRIDKQNYDQLVAATRANAVGKFDELVRKSVSESHLVA